MMIRSLLLSSALVTGVVTGFSGEALAQRGMTLKPADSWSVAKYDGPEANGDAYCAVARRFDRSTIVTIAKNTKNESSLAVDFQSQRLNPNNVLSVSLDPGAAQMREFEIFPASEKAFVLRLGRDEDFFDALARTGHLRAEIGSKAFNFDMADVGSGYSALGKCLDSVQKSLASGQRANPSSGQPAALRADEMQGGVFNDAPSASSLAAAPVPSVPAVSTGNGEVDALVRRIEDLERRNGDLNTQLARVSGQSAGSVRQLEEITVLKQENERIRTSLMDARSGAEQVHDLRMELEQLKAKNYVMEQDLAVARTGEGEASVLQERVRSLTTALDDVKAERDAAQAKLAQLELEQSMLRERAAQGDAVRGERLGLMEQQVNALQERIALMTSTIEEKDTAIMALNEQVREAESLRLANAEMQAEIAAKAGSEEILGNLKSQIEALETKNATLQIQIETYKMQGERLASLEMEKARLESDLAQADDAQGQATAFQGELAKLRLEAAEKDRQLLQLAEQAIQLEQVRIENAALKERMAQNVSSADLIVDLQSRIDDTKAKNAALQLQVGELLAQKELAVAQVTQLTSENVKLQEDLEQVAALEGRLQVVDAQKAALEAQKLSLEARVAALESVGPSYQAQASSLQEQIVQKDMEIARANERLASLELEGKADEVRADTLEAQLASLNQTLDAKNQELSSLTNRLATLDVVERENADLTAKLMAYAKDKPAMERLQAQLDQSEAQRRALESQISVTQAEVSSYGQQQQELIAQLEEKDARIAQLTSEKDVLAQDFKALEEQVAMMAAEKLELTAQLTRVEAEARAAKVVMAENESLKQDVATLAAMEQQIEALASEKVALQAEVIAMKAQEPIFQNEIASLKDDKAALELQISGLQGDGVSLKEKLAGLSSSKGTLEQQLADVTREMRMRDARIEALSLQLSEVEDLRQENSRLQEELAFKAESDQVIASLRERVASLETDNKALEQKLAMAGEREQVVANLQSQVQGLETQNLALQSEIEAFEQGQTDMAMLAEENQRLRREMQNFERVSAQQSGQQRMRPERIQPAAGEAQLLEEDIQREVLRAQPVSTGAPVSTPRREDVISAAQPVEEKPNAFVEDLLRVAGIQDARAVSAPGQDRTAFRWEVGDVFGSAEQRPLLNAQAFDEQVMEYLQSARNSCAGDFAIVPDDKKEIGAMRLDSYELACIGAENSFSASLIFLKHEGTFASVVHETSALNMDDAMDVRDRMIEKISGQVI